MFLKKKINHEFINVEKEINIEGFKKVLSFQDEPFHGTNCIYQFFLAHEIKKQMAKLSLPKARAFSPPPPRGRLLDTEQQHLVALPSISSGNAASTTLTAASSW